MQHKSKEHANPDLFDVARVKLHFYSAVVSHRVTISETAVANYFGIRNNNFPPVAVRENGFGKKGKKLLLQYFNQNF